MFDLKKRNSLTLKGSREAEEFRRVAVRRREKSGGMDCSSSDVSNGVCGSYSYINACDSLCGPQPNHKIGEADKIHPAIKSPFKADESPKPTRLLSPQRIGWDQTCSPTKGQVAGAGDYGRYVSCIYPSQNLQVSPVRGGGQSFLSAPSGTHSSAVFLARGDTKVTNCSVLGSPSPSKRAFQSCSPLRGGLSPAKLSPTNHMGKLQSLSPVQKKMVSHSPAKNSKSWLGLHKVSSNKMESQEKKVEKSLSVPDLLIHMDEDRITSEKIQRSPLKQLQSANGFVPDVPIRTYHRLSLPSSENHAANTDVECSLNVVMPSVGNAKEVEEKMTDGKMFTRHGSKFFCEWMKTLPGNEEISKNFGGEKDEKKNGEDDLKNKEEKLYKIANELLQTERAYVARLHLLDRVFCSRLTEEANRGSFPPEVVKNIFSNTSSIFSFHSQFLLPDLENCIRNWKESPGLGKALLQHAPFMRMYADYVRSFDQAMELLRTWTERSSAFRNIIQDIQRQEVCGNLTLQHHMLEPVQRLPRYEMLLKDYLKKLPDDNPDHDLAQKSLEAISMAATHSNAAIQKAENLKKLLEIYEMVGDEEVVNPSNEFIREGRLLKLAARNTSAMERHLFLFNNFLLCCTPKFSLVGQRFTVRCRIGVDGMKVHPTTNEGHPHTFQVSGKEKTLELQTSSEQDRDHWIKAIREAVDLFERKNETFKLASKELNLLEHPKELGRRAPRWIRDNEVTLCMTCQEPFNALTRRRHHCRACGFVVCGKCSDYKVALEYDGNKPNKVCKACYPILTGSSSERMDRKKRKMLESEIYPESPDCVMSSILMYSGNSVSQQQVWCVLSRNDDLLLHVYATPQELKLLFTIPLLDCCVEASPSDLQDQHSFCLRQTKTSHIFSCDCLEMTQKWLTALNDALTRKIPDHDNEELTLDSLGDGEDEESEERWLLNV